jgi:hypothetical protein
LLFAATPAAGDPVQIRHGGVGFDTGDPPGLSLVGDGFSLTSLFPSIGPFTLCTSGCFPGDVISPSTVFGAESFDFLLGTGFATVDGTTYGTAIAGQGSVLFRGTLSFDASPVVIPTPTGAALPRATSPFVLTGTIAGFQRFDATTPLFSVDVFGSGLATLVLEPLENGPPGTLFFRAIRYDIVDPVPEPATLLLFGGGLAGLLMRRRHGRKRPTVPLG